MGPGTAGTGCSRKPICRSGVHMVVWCVRIDITDAPAWTGVVLPAQQGGARRPEFRPRDADVHIPDVDELLFHSIATIASFSASLVSFSASLASFSSGVAP